MADFDGDGKTDISVFRPGSGTWYVRGSAGTDLSTTFDSSSVPVPGDYNGDGKTDLAVYEDGLRQWLIPGQSPLGFGSPGDIPVPGDYNGDGKTDIAVYHPINSGWYFADGTFLFFGTTGDIAVPGDYNGDGKTDIAVYRPSTGAWYVRGQTSTTWGRSIGYSRAPDIPVPGDYNGDGKTDFAVYRPGEAYPGDASSTAGTWYIQGGGSIPWGTSTDIPVPGDFDGDGKTDVAVFRPGTGDWFVRQSSGATMTARYGLASDVNTVSTPSLVKQIGQLNDHSTDPSVSGDGQVVAYTTLATNVSSDDHSSPVPSGGVFQGADVVVLDRNTGVSTPILPTSLSGGVFSPSLSGDGRFLAYCSRLPTGLFVRDLLNQTTTLVDASGCWPSLSSDGRSVVYGTGTGQVMWEDLTTLQRVAVSVNVSGQTVGGSLGRSGISAAGGYVVFCSTDSNLVPQTVGQPAIGRIYLRDMAARTTTLVSIANSGALPNGASMAGCSPYEGAPGVSPDGHLVSFSSDASNLMDGSTDPSMVDTDGVSDVFMRDVVGHATVRVSHVYEAQQPNGASTMPVMSADGSRIVFSSNASNMLSNDTNGTSDIFEWDTIARSLTARLSYDDYSRQEGNGWSGRPAISADAQTVAFGTFATNFADNTNGVENIVVHEWLPDLPGDNTSGGFDVSPGGSDGVIGGPSGQIARSAPRAPATARTPATATSATTAPGCGPAATGATAAHLGTVRPVAFRRPVRSPADQSARTWLVLVVCGCLLLAVAWCLRRRRRAVFILLIATVCSVLWPATAHALQCSVSGVSATASESLIDFGRSDTADDQWEATVNSADHVTGSFELDPNDETYPTGIKGDTINDNGDVIHDVTVSKPTCALRLIDGQAYKDAKKKRKNANAALHRKHPEWEGLQIHEIVPIKFGGSPDATENKIVLDKDDHNLFTNFWGKLKREKEKPTPPAPPAPPC